LHVLSIYNHSQVSAKTIFFLEKSDFRNLFVFLRRWPDSFASAPVAQIEVPLRPAAAGGAHPRRI